ncbi:MAG: SDR family oxidoreductase [Microcoleus sp. SIO2G3]|nr:SDR family oxidoreductase [Microcoleus sp. SIO2G3]
MTCLLKVTIVAGAVRGVGKCMAEGLVEFGAKVIICDLSVVKALETAQAINRVGGVDAGTSVRHCARLLQEHCCEEILRKLTAA